MMNVIAKIGVWAFVLFFVGCKSTQKTQKSKTKLHEIVHARTDDSVYSETLEYGDSMQVYGYVPVDGQMSIESKGIGIKADVHPVFDSSGKLLGNRVKIDANAKPVKIHRSGKVKNTHRHLDQKMNIDQREKIKEKPRISFWIKWVGLLLLIGFFYIAIRFIRKKFFII